MDKITDVHNSLADVAEKMREILSDRTIPQSIRDRIAPLKTSVQVAAAVLDEIQQSMIK